MRIFNYFLTACLLLHLMQVKAQCTTPGSHYTASYPSGWTITDWDPGWDSKDCNDDHNGTLYLSGTAAYFISARGSRELRASSAIPTVSNTSWTMDFTLIVNPSTYDPNLLATNSPSVVLAALTDDQQSLQTTCTTPPTGSGFCASCGTYPNTNMDAIWVYLTSNPPTSTLSIPAEDGCNQSQEGKNWRIVGAARDGNGTQNNSTAISIPTGVAGTYYIRLQRTDVGSALVSVFANSNFTNHLSGSPQCVSIPGSVTNLDVLTHEVHAQGICSRTFNGIVDHVKIDNNLACGPALTSSFTMPTQVCQGQPIVVNGSNSSGSVLPIANHEWLVEECDASGNGIGGPVWWGPWTAGNPGSYTLPYASMAAAGVNPTCGKYYRVSLALQNCAFAWVSSTKIIYITCAPSIQTTPSITICQGESTTLSFSYRGSTNYTVVWKSISPTEQTLYNGPVSNSSIVVTPSVTTNYQVTMTDNVTGCSTTAFVTVTVASLDPTFGISNTLNSGYYTISATPTDLNSYSTSGFQYGWTIEELNGTGSPYYGISSISGTTCWWNYPTPETFLGFVSTGTGTYTQNPGPSCGSTPGKFLYNHTYRITRLVLNDYCPARQYSTIITTTKSGGVITYEDPKAPDMTYMLKQNQQHATDNITIFPNPGTGIFTIELKEGEGASLIEVTNAFGQKVKSFEAEGERSELDLKGYTKGIYIVTITSNGRTTAKKIVLE